MIWGFFFNRSLFSLFASEMLYIHFCTLTLKKGKFLYDLWSFIKLQNIRKTHFSENQYNNF